MGLMDDIEAAESARARGEPVGGRIRRRIGFVVLAMGIFLSLVGSYASSWHVLDYDVVGYDRSQVRVGLWDIEICPERSDCEEMHRYAFDQKVGPLSRSSDAEVNDWFDARWQVGVGLFLSAAAAAALLFVIITAQRFRVVRLVAAGTFVVAATAMLLALRSSFAAPVDFMGRGLASYLALAGLFDVVLGAVLIGITRVGHDGPLPPAVVVRR